MKKVIIIVIVMISIVEGDSCFSLSFYIKYIVYFKIL